MRLATRVLPIIILLIFTASVEARPAEPWQGDPFSADPNSLFSAAGPAMAGAEVPARALLDETLIVFDAAEQHSRTRHLIYQILTQEGVEELSSMVVMEEAPMASQAS